MAGALALGLSLGACGGDDGGSSTSENSPAAGLSAGLEGIAVSSTDDPVTVMWADTARLLEAAGLPDDAMGALADERWRIPVTYVLGPPLTNLKLLGFDPASDERTVAIGRPPNMATFFGGVDTSGTRAALEKLGYDESDGFLANGEEGGIITDTPDLVGLNRVAIEASDVAVGGFEAPVAAAIGRQGEQLDTVDGIAAASDCLGPDTLVAQVDDPEEGAADEVALQAVGVETPDEGDVVPEVICAVAVPGESLDDVSDCMEGTFNDGGFDPLTNRPFADEIGEAEVTEGELDGTAWVRATFEPPSENPVGMVLNYAARGTLAGPLGGDPAGAYLGDSSTPQQIQALQDEQPDSCRS